MNMKASACKKGRSYSLNHFDWLTVRDGYVFANKVQVYVCVRNEMIG